MDITVMCNTKFGQIDPGRCPPSRRGYSAVACTHWSLKGHGHDPDWEGCGSRGGQAHGYVSEKCLVASLLDDSITLPFIYTHTGLANRVVSKGKSLEEALKLANQIAEFPQGCLRADRRSAYCSMYRSQGFLRSLGYENRQGGQVLDEARAGARKFTEGVGRGGTFK